MRITSRRTTTFSLSLLVASTLCAVEVPNIGTALKEIESSKLPSKEAPAVPQINVQEPTPDRKSVV